MTLLLFIVDIIIYLFCMTLLFYLPTFVGIVMTHLLPLLLFYYLFLPVVLW